MKKLLLPVVALLLLAGGGGGAYFYMGKSEAAAPEAKVEEAKAEEGAEGEKPEITYLPMERIILPIIDRSGITQTVSMVVSLQVDDKAKVENVKAKLPLLADAFLSDMYGTLSQKAAMQSGVIKVSTLKARLVAITDKIMGEKAVNGVLLQVLQQHPA